MDNRNVKHSCVVEKQTYDNGNYNNEYYKYYSKSNTRLFLLAPAFFHFWRLILLWIRLMYRVSFLLFL